MYPRVIFSVFASFGVSLVGCQTQNAAAPGISSAEMRVLVSEYYWKPDSPAPRYSDAQLATLLRESADPTLDGARSEMQTSRVVVALASIGDDAFSRALARQPDTVKRAVAREVVYLWSRHGLHYPSTEALLRPYT